MAKAHHCDVPNCTNLRKRWQRLCETCFTALPGDIRAGILEAHQQSRKADWRRERRRAAAHMAALPPLAAPGRHRPRIAPERAFELNQRLLGER